MPNRKKNKTGCFFSPDRKLALKESGKGSYYDRSGLMEMATVPHKSDILNTSVRKLTMSDSCESSSSSEEKEESEEIMDISLQSCCQQESLFSSPKCFPITFTF